MTKYIVGVKSQSISFKLNYSSTSLELRALSFFLYFFLLSSFPFCSCFSTISVANSFCFDVLAIFGECRQFGLQYIFSGKIRLFTTYQQCVNCIIFLSVSFYVKSQLGNPESKNLPFLQLLTTMNFNFMRFVHFWNAGIYQINTMQSS